MSTPEAKVKKAVKQWLVDRGAYYYMPVSNGMGRVGAPDFIVCLSGRFVGIETKAPGKRGNTTPNQQRELQGINRAGGMAFVVDDVKQLEVLAPLLEKTNDRQAQAQKAGAEATQPKQRTRRNPHGEAAGL